MSKKNRKSCNYPTAPPSYNQSFQHQVVPPCQPPPYTPYGSPPPAPQVVPQPYTYYQPSTSNVTVYVPNQFDSGARFDISRPTIPPPPPGVLPNAAQLAAMQGHNVVVTQRKSDFWFGD